MVLEVIHGNNLDVLAEFPDGYFRLIYLDPPFNTGKTQARKGISYKDSFDNFHGFITPRIREFKRLLSKDGSLFLHLDYRESHYVKVWTDEIFGKDNFMNEIIWSYDFGARNKHKWPTKHDTILWYAKNKNSYIFHYDEIDRVPYLSKGLVSPEKKAKGKTLTDVWFNTIVHTMSPENLGYPTQKPISILNRIVKVHSNPGDFLLDPFAGSGSFGQSALLHNRHCILIDDNIQAIDIMRNRFSGNLNVGFR